MNIIHYSKAEQFSKQPSAAHTNTVIAINSRLVCVHNIKLPKMSHTKSIKALPFALEPQLLDDIDDLTFFPQKSTVANEWNVLVIASKALSALKTKLDESTSQVTAVVPDFMLLPFQQGKITFFEQDDDTIYRNGVLQGGRMNSDLFKEVFAEQSQLLAAKLSNTAFGTINLLTNNMRENVQKYLKPWRFAAAAAALMLVISTAQDIIKNQQLGEQLIAQKASNEQQFRAIFPNVKKIINIRAQTRQKIAKLSKQKNLYKNDFLTKLSAQTNSAMRAKKLTFSNQKLSIQNLK